MQLVEIPLSEWTKGGDPDLLYGFEDADYLDTMSEVETHVDGGREEIFVHRRVPLPTDAADRIADWVAAEARDAWADSGCASSDGEIPDAIIDAVGVFRASLRANLKPSDATLFEPTGEVLIVDDAKPPRRPISRIVREGVRIARGSGR